MRRVRELSRHPRTPSRVSGVFYCRSFVFLRVRHSPAKSLQGSNAPRVASFSFDHSTAQSCILSRGAGGSLGGGDVVSGGAATGSRGFDRVFLTGAPCVAGSPGDGGRRLAGR